MELLTNRYRSLTALALVVLGQLLLLGYQVRGRGEVRLIRVWAVTAVTPAARVLESVRSGVASILDDYVLLVGVQEENRGLKEELGRLKLEARRLRNELATAKRAEALQLFAATNPSEVLATRIIGAGTGSGSRVVFVDRGSGDGVARGMAVITPDAVVGKVSAVYPTASQVILITDPSFAAGVVSQERHIQGTLKGRGGSLCSVDYVQNDEEVSVGEWFYTSGDDRVFPRGLPVGRVHSVREGSALQEIAVVPEGLRNGLEEVLIVLEGVHQPVPEGAPRDFAAELLPPPAEGTSRLAPAPDGAATPRRSTEADRLVERYRRMGEAQGHVFGEGEPGSAPPDFNLDSRRLSPDSAAPEPSSAVRTPE